MACFLDANIFVYAAGREHPFKLPCLRVLGEVVEGRLDAFTNAEVIQELMHLFARRGMRDRGIALARKAMTVVSDVLPVTGEVMELSCRLAEQYPGLPIRDLVHVATMQINSLGQIVSVDVDFDCVREITRIDPCVEQARPGG